MPFLKQEFLLSVLVGMLVLAFVHMGTQGKTREDFYQDDAGNVYQQRVPDPVGTASYMKLFLGTVVGVYLLLYMLHSSGSSNSPSLGGGPSLPSIGNGAFDDAIKAALKHIDVGEPTF